MSMISHNDATILEHELRRLFKCDRGGVSGLVDADTFDKNPMCAAYLVIAYIYAKGMESSQYQYDDFLCKYEYVFNNSSEFDLEVEVRNYIKDLTSIIDLYLKLF